MVRGALPGEFRDFADRQILAFRQAGQSAAARIDELEQVRDSATAQHEATWIFNFVSQEFKQDLRDQLSRYLKDVANDL